MPIGSYRHRVTVEGPGDPVPDGDGGYTEGYGPLDPGTWDCSIAPATTKDLEQVAGGTVISQATHIVKGRYHRGLTTRARLVFKGRVLNVVHVANREERDIESILICAEVVE